MAAKKAAVKKKTSAKKKAVGKKPAKKKAAKKKAAKRKAAVKLPVLWPKGGKMVWDIRTFLQVDGIAKNKKLRAEFEALLDRHAFDIEVPSEYVNAVKKLLCAKGLHKSYASAQWIASCPCPPGKFV